MHYIRALQIVLVVHIILPVTYSVCNQAEIEKWRNNPRFTKEMAIMSPWDAGRGYRCASVLQYKYGLAPTCAPCHRDVVACTALNCVLICPFWGWAHQRCVGCSENHCHETYKNCIGTDNVEDLPLSPLKLVNPNADWKAIERELVQIEKEMLLAAAAVAKQHGAKKTTKSPGFTYGLFQKIGNLAKRSEESESEDDNENNVEESDHESNSQYSSSGASQSDDRQEDLETTDDGSQELEQDDNESNSPLIEENNSEIYEDDDGDTERISGMSEMKIGDSLLEDAKQPEVFVSNNVGVSIINSAGNTFYYVPVDNPDERFEDGESPGLDGDSDIPEDEEFSSKDPMTSSRALLEFHGIHIPIGQELDQLTHEQLDKLSHSLMVETGDELGEGYLNEKTSFDLSPSDPDNQQGLPPMSPSELSSSRSYMRGTSTGRLRTDSETPLLTDRSRRNTVDSTESGAPWTPSSIADPIHAPTQLETHGEENDENRDSDTDIHRNNHQLDGDWVVLGGVTMDPHEGRVISDQERQMKEKGNPPDSEAIEEVVEGAADKDEVRSLLDDSDFDNDPVELPVIRVFTEQAQELEEQNLKETALREDYVVVETIDAQEDT